MDFARRRTYTPERTARWETHAAWTIRESWSGRAPLSVPVAVRVTAVFPRPKRLCTRRLVSTTVVHVARPDADNVLKAAGDALEKAGVIVNDSLAWRVEVVKRYAAQYEQPHVGMVLTWDDSR